MAIYWPTPGLKGRTFKLCVLTRWDLISASAAPHCGVLTVYVFMKVSLSSNIIVCGWLGAKHQLTKMCFYIEILGYLLVSSCSFLSLFMCLTVKKCCFSALVGFLLLLLLVVRHFSWWRQSSILAPLFHDREMVLVCFSTENCNFSISIQIVVSCLSFPPFFVLFRR